MEFFGMVMRDHQEDGIAGRGDKQDTVIRRRETRFEASLARDGVGAQPVELDIVGGCAAVVADIGAFPVFDPEGKALVIVRIWYAGRPGGDFYVLGDDL